MASNDPTGLAQALDDIEALKKELREQRAQFEVFARFVCVSLENIAEYLKGTANKADIERVREGIIVASEMVRANVADVVAAAAEKVAKGRH